MDERGFYVRHSRLTDPGEHAGLFAGVAADVAGLSSLVRDVMVHRDETARVFGFELPVQRREQAQTRYVSGMLGWLGDLSPRPPRDRFAGTCRDFSLMLCGLLRANGVPARLRHGFAGYFTPGFFDDHVVVEYWTDGAGWRLADAQIAGLARPAYPVPFDPADVPRDEFLVAGQAWLDCRHGGRDPETFGVASAGLTGMWEIQGNVVRDLASLNRAEPLPWDSWGLIPQHYTTLSADDRDLLDRAARIGADGGPVCPAMVLYQGDSRLYAPDTVSGMACDLPATTPAVPG